jgi:nucleotide-binding universal stress UspA family protein
MNTILAITEHVGKMEAFLKYAVQLAIDLNNNLRVVHVQAPPVHPPSVGSSGMFEMDAGQHILMNREIGMKALEKDIAKVRQSLNVPPDFELHYEVETATADMMPDEYESSMILLEGDNDESFVFAGSANMDVIRKADCPVLVIPKGMVYKQIHKVLYATDFKQSDIESFKKLIKIIDKYALNITALHVADALDSEEKARKDEFKAKVEAETHYSGIQIISIEAGDHDIGVQINEFALASGYDLIAILKKNRNFFERMFKSSSTKKVITESHLPILVFQERE